MMARLAWTVALTLACAVTACTTETKVVEVEVLVYPDGWSPDTGWIGQTGDGVGTYDGQDDAGHDDLAAPDVGVDDAWAEDIAPDVAPDPASSGVTSGDGIVVTAEGLDGVFIFGVGVEPGSSLGQIGNTVAGAIAIPAVVQLNGSEAEIRVYDLDDDAPVEGDDGLIESYPYAELDDGSVRIDFGKPHAKLEVQVWGGCTYVLDEYILVSEPVYADALITWTAVESFYSQNCGGGGLPASMGINVHFLRRFDANLGFQPRKVDPEMPFGFFQVEAGDTTWLTRLPYTGPDEPDAKVVYYLEEDFPEHLRHLVYEVFEHWNIVLEQTAGNRPFLLLDDPPALVPWDPRYRVVSWDESESSGAIAPFVEHPVTGEMFDTDVIVWLANLPDLIQNYTKFFEDNPDLPYDFGVGDDDDDTGMFLAGAGDDSGVPPRVLRRRAFAKRPMNPAQLQQTLSRVSLDLSPEEIEQLIIYDFLTHELGHNLGLRHNFKGSIDVNHHLPQITSTSAMDYVIGMAYPGSYDADAMRYGYGTGALDDTFFYCTDQDVPYDPGCAKWDLGHPVRHALAKLDAMAAKYPPGTPDGEVEGAAYEGEWSDTFSVVRQFFNSEYEQYDPNDPVYTYLELLDRVMCLSEPEPEPEPDADAGSGDPVDAGGGAPPPDAGSSDVVADAPPTEDAPPGIDPVPCDIHVWLRRQWALYLLYTKHAIDGEWTDYPALSPTQAAYLFDNYLDLITDPSQPGSLKKTIIDKLPTSGVIGADAFLQTLYDHFEAIDDPTAEEDQIFDWIIQATS